MDFFRSFFRREAADGIQSNLLATHIVPWLIIIVVIGLIFGFRRQLRNSKSEYKFRFGITIIFVIFELFHCFWRFWDYGNSVPHELSTLLFQGCAVAFTMVSISSLRNKAYPLKYVLFLGIVGPLMTFTIGPYTSTSFDTFRYWHFYLSHIYTFTMIMYYFIVKQPKLTWDDFKTSFIFMFIYSSIALILNLSTGANVLYLYNAAQTPFEGWFWGLSIPIIVIGFFIPFYLFYFFKNEKVDGKRIHFHTHYKNNKITSKK